MPLIGLVRLQRGLSGAIPGFYPIVKMKLGDHETAQRRKCLCDLVECECGKPLLGRIEKKSVTGTTWDGF